MQVVRRVISASLDEEHSLWVVPGILLIAFGFRLFLLLLMPDAHLSTNAKEAIIEGANLIDSGQFLWNPYFPTHLPPLSAFLAWAFGASSGDSLFGLKLFQVLLGTVSVLLAFRIGRAVFGYSVAVVSAMVLALYPFLAFTSVYIGSEVLYIFLLLLFVDLFLVALNREGVRPYFIAGLVLGLSALTRGTSLFLFLFVALFVTWYSWPTKSRDFMRISVLIVAFALVLAPWTLRNAIVYGDFIPTSTPGLPVLNGASEEFWEIESRSVEYPKYFEYLKEEKGISPRENPNWAEKGDFYRQAALVKYKERWEERPFSYVPFTVKKFARLWYATESGNNHALILALNLPIYIFALLGVLHVARNRLRIPVFLLILIAYFVALHVAVFTLFRFLLPVIPIVVLFAVYGAERTLTQVRQRL